MFYEGDLQSGISKALQESKLVACFVTDDGPESQLWINFLEDFSIKSLLAEQTVLLRLEAGSKEEGYLAAIFPLPKTPTLVIIQNGQLKEYLVAGISKEEFLRRITLVFQSRVPPPTGQHPEPQPVASTRSDFRVPQEIEEPLLASANANPEVAAASSSQVVQDLLSERSTRLEAHKKGQESKEKAKRVAEAKARKSALEEEAPAGSKKTADIKYALIQKKRQQDAREERARILKRVEDDKAERRLKEARRKAQTKSKEDSQINGQTTTPATLVPSHSSQSKECALQVRLFDGSTIRSRFSSQNSLRAVRMWIDQQQTADIPYTFKHVLTPIPNRNISISDEEQTLHSQGLAPSATLILIPVQSYTLAYENGNGSGYISRGFATGYGLVSSGLDLVTGVLGTLLGGRPTQETQATHVEPTHNAPSTEFNVRTQRDQDRSEYPHFYNGNALDFEPRPDNEGKREE